MNAAARATGAQFSGLRLLPHPAAPAAAAVTALSVSGSIDAAGSLQLVFELLADLQALRMPPPAATPARCDGLWRHSCFEAFARRGADRRYLEFNFATSGDWAAYEFSDCRQGQAALAQSDLSVTALQAAPDRLLLRARADLSALSSANDRSAAAAPWHFNLAAVLEDHNGALSYWALHHPCALPDFHDVRGFRLELPPPPLATKA